MKIIDEEVPRWKRNGAAKNAAPADPTLQAIKALTKAIESIKPPQQTPNGVGAKEHAVEMAVLLSISNGIKQLTEQLTNVPEVKESPKKWHFEVTRNKSGKITSIDATKK